MFDSERSLQDPVRVIAIFLGCLTILVGVSSIVHDGDLELSIVGIAINIFVSGVLFLGAKRRSTTHLMVWLMFTMLQIIGLLIGICYFSYEAESLRILINSPQPLDPLKQETLDRIREQPPTDHKVHTLSLNLTFSLVKPFHFALVGKL